MMFKMGVSVLAAIVCLSGAAIGCPNSEAAASCHNAKVENAAAVTEKSGGCCKAGAKVENAANVTETKATCSGDKAAAGACCKSGAKVENAANVTEKKACCKEGGSCCKGAKVENAATVTAKGAIGWAPPY